MKPQHTSLLMLLAKKGMDLPLKTSSMELARESGLSQQSTSRLLGELAQAGYIQRQVKPNGQTITITPRGKHQLRQLYAQLGAIFVSKKRTITGIIVEGLGEGKQYMAMQGYKKQFRKKLDFTPYAGTLNLEVTPAVGKAVHADPTFFHIEGFATRKRTYGGLRCKRARLSIKGKKIEGAVILPDRTSHKKNIIEFVAPVQVKEKLGIKNGTKVLITL